MGVYDFFRFSEMLTMTSAILPLSSWRSDREALFQTPKQLSHLFPNQFRGLLWNNPGRNSTSLKMSSGWGIVTSQGKGKGFSVPGNLHGPTGQSEDTMRVSVL